MGELGHRQPSCNRPRVQSSRPFNHACSSKERSGTVGRKVAVCPIPSRGDIRWLCNGFRIRVVVPLVQQRAADQFLPVGEVLGISCVLDD